jgi:hypothetical protein
MKGLHAVGFILLIIGGLNWGLVGLNPDWNLVTTLLGDGSVLSKIVYLLVGIAAVVELLTHKSSCYQCGSGKCKTCSTDNKKGESVSGDM